MSPDLADFGDDYRSVNLQRPSAYLLVKNFLFSFHFIYFLVYGAVR